MWVEGRNRRPIRSGCAENLPGGETAWFRKKASSRVVSPGCDKLTRNRVCREILTEQNFLSTYAVPSTCLSGAESGARETLPALLLVACLPSLVRATRE